MMLFWYSIAYRCAALAVLVACLVTGHLSAVAQSSNSLSESEFWSLMNQTESALQNSDASGVEIARLQVLWADVSIVRLDDGTQVVVDLDWLTSGLAQTEPSDRQKLQERVAALLDYRTMQSIPAGTGDPLNTLDRVLQDSRFQYPDVTPTPPMPPPTEDAAPPENPVLPQPAAELSQIVLLVAGIIVVMFVVGYFARGLQIQSAGTTDTLEPNQDPETSLHAEELATTSETIRDYRAAVRYLYLSSLLLLDERGLIRYDRTLTNREHLQQIADRPQLLELLRPVVGTFDRVWYGFAPLDERLYEEYRHNVERLRELAR
jgi:hypothetical protein